MKKLDLETLKQIKQVFNYCSDMSTKCMGYNYICQEIDRLEEKEKLKITELENNEIEAVILIETLDEHRT